MRPKDEVPLLCVFFYIKCCIYLYSFSSPYLRVFGDDRVRGTRSRCCCRWFWWSLKPERGLVGKLCGNVLSFDEF